MPPSKRQTRKPQPSPPKPRTPRKGPNSLKERKFPGRRIVEFPNMKGRKLEKVEIYTSGGHHSIVIGFEDNTALDLAIEPGFTLRAVQRDRQPGGLKVLRRWPDIFSER